MKVARNIDLGRSLRQVFGDDPESASQVARDCARQTATAKAILRRFFSRNHAKRREFMILADEVGLGKTYVALAVAVSLLDAIRRGEQPAGMPSQRPAVLVLTPGNNALYQKWVREAEAFRHGCARREAALDWLQIACPRAESRHSGNLADVAEQARCATRRRPLLLIAKQGALGAALDDREWWRIRALFTVFRHFGLSPAERRYWCRRGRVFEQHGVPDLRELLDFRRAAALWEEEPLSGLKGAFAKALDDAPELQERIGDALDARDAGALTRRLDGLTRRSISRRLPRFPLVIVDEVHTLKNQHVQARRHFERLLSGRVSRVLGLSATPFQLRHDELLSVLMLRRVLAVSGDRALALDGAVDRLAAAMGAARNSGDVFRRRWRRLRSGDEKLIADGWQTVCQAAEPDRVVRAQHVRPPRVAHALEAALDLEERNRDLARRLAPFVIRHRHPRGYREHFIGRYIEARDGDGSPHFAWAPGLEVTGKEELAHYLMMRAVALAKDEKGLPGLGAELTGSYRHLTETAAVWRKLAAAKNPALRQYRATLERMIGPHSGGHDPDGEHRKIQATVRRALEFFKRGQKTLIFCVFTKTAEAVRDQVQAAVMQYLDGQRDAVFGTARTFENFRRRFFDRREPLFSMIQDHPLLGPIGPQRVGVPRAIALTLDALREVGRLLVSHGEPPDIERPDRRLLLAAVEHVAVRRWQESHRGREWLEKEMCGCPDLLERMSDVSWLEAREPLSRSERAGRVRRARDAAAGGDPADPLDLEQFDEERAWSSNGQSEEAAIEAWVRRLREDAIGAVVSPYFRSDIIASSESHVPLLARHHEHLLAQFDLHTRAVAGQVFRRVLMAPEFVLRYLTDVERENSERWSSYLAERYTKPLQGHRESLCDRVQAYFETLARACRNRALISGYHTAAENRNVVQLVRGGIERDRYFLGFNTPYRPEILVSTSVGQEGIDLHRECRHVIHHDLCWNPATIEQRTGRLDRIGSKVERERMGVENGDAPTLEIAVPYLAATYDERMFEELYRRAQLFEVTLGGEMRVDGRAEPERTRSEGRRVKGGIGAQDEDLGQEDTEAAAVDLPPDMVERLRVDLSVWKSRAGEERSR